MGLPPNAQEWDTSALPQCRRDYLDGRWSFDQLAASLVAESVICHVLVEPYDTHPPSVPKETRRVRFRASISHKTYDLLFNAPDGLRGRYWQSPDEGASVTRRLIHGLEDKLLAYAASNAPILISPAKTMDLAEMSASLNASSAKVWVRERDDNNNYIGTTVGPQLKVRRWHQNETADGSKGQLWRWTVVSDSIEITGGFLDPDGNEHVPDGKQDRSLQIHRFGFS